MQFSKIIKLQFGKNKRHRLLCILLLFRKIVAKLFLKNVFTKIYFFRMVIVQKYICMRRHCPKTKWQALNRPFCKMAAENSNKLKLKTYTSTTEDHFYFSIPAKFYQYQLIKCKLKNEQFTEVCMTGSMTYTPSHTNVCKFVKFHLTFPKLI